MTKTKIVFSRNGLHRLLFTKFEPGLSIIVPPLAGFVWVCVHAPEGIRKLFIGEKSFL